MSTGYVRLRTEWVAVRTPATVPTTVARMSRPLIDTDGAIAPSAPCLARSNLAALVGDLVPLADLVSLLLLVFAGHALLAVGWLPAGLADALHGGLAPAAAVAAVLAPFMLYDQRFGAQAGQGRHRDLMAAHALRFSAYAVIVVVLALVSDATAVHGWLAIWLVSSLLVTSVTRVFAVGALRRLSEQGRLTETVAVVGGGPVADRLVRALRDVPARRIDLLGVFDDAPARPGPVGSIAQLVALAGQRRIDWIVLTIDPVANPRQQALLRQLRGLGVAIGLCPQHIGLSPVTLLPVPVGQLLTMGILVKRPIDRWDAIVKSVEDRLLGGVITLLLLPLLALIALAIRLDSPGPVVYRQRRHALDNREFEIYKFRTMRWEPEAAGQALAQTERGDRRITRIGRFLRASSLDELPQLFNVLEGTMSLVGPRPHAVDMRTEAQLGTQITDNYPHRHRVKPGITGWAQVNGARGATTTAAQLRRRVEFDLHYIEHWSLWLDLKILARTVGVVLRRTNAF
jgi:Undecaprenyl-phosphate glucose phosphotransferase